MQLIKWLCFMLMIAWIGSLFLSEAQDRVQAAQARAWYEQTQGERQHSGREERAREWQAFRDCVATGEKPVDCALN